VEFLQALQERAQHSWRTIMKHLMKAFLAASVTSTTISMFLVTSPRAWADDGVETIVLLRHGEKPEGGLGQLNCQGLNRALALPEVIAKEFGKPDFIFAPDPSDQKKDSGEFYDYVRPLATIEPTAIKFGLPVDASIGASHTDQLEVALEKRRYHNAVVIVAWEHNDIVTIARDLLSANGGDATRVPEEWPGHDFDSLFVITITRDGKSTNASFERKHEGLDGQPIDCR
jgi:hypothetical protein